MVEATFRPRGPFSLRLSAVWASDATRRFDGRILLGLFEVEDGVARRNPVRVGIRAADKSEIRNGLSENACVIRNPSETLKDGGRVIAKGC